MRERGKRQIMKKKFIQQLSKKSLGILPLLISQDVRVQLHK